MEKLWMKLIFAALTLVNIFALSAEASQAKALCQPSRASQLAMDQRDDERLHCLKKKRNQLSASQCLQITKTMEYSNNAEDARLVCLYDLNKSPSLKECAAIAKSMEYADSGDEVRWECIRRFAKVLSTKQCLTFARAMSYPANSQRADIYCKQELN
ncbi:MAG: hypothetical protein ACM3MG_06365 [Bacillota bacterium]